MIYLAVALIFLFVISVPITIRINVRVNSDEGIGELAVRLFFIPIFKKRIPSRLNEYIKASENNKTEKPPSRKKKKPNGFLMSAALKLLGLIVVRDMELDSKIGTGDAAASAVICGALTVGYGHVCDFLCCEKKGEITPIYDSEALNIRFFGIFSASFADIIYVVAAAVYDRIKKSIGARKNYAKSVAE